MVENGVDSDGSLAGLSVADDELTLASADGHQTVDRLESGLHRLVHRLSGDDTGRLDLHPVSLRSLDRSQPVDRVS